MSSSHASTLIFAAAVVAVVVKTALVVHAVWEGEVEEVLQLDVCVGTLIVARAVAYVLDLCIANSNETSDVSEVLASFKPMELVVGSGVGSGIKSEGEIREKLEKLMAECMQSEEIRG